jgi:hypothetical protein
MNLDFNLIVGLLAVVYGVYSFIQRKVAPENIEKLQTMIERNGEKMAHSIHLVGYTIFPVIAGLLLLFIGSIYDDTGSALRRRLASTRSTFSNFRSMTSG